MQIKETKVYNHLLMLLMWRNKNVDEKDFMQTFIQLAATVHI